MSILQPDSAANFKKPTTVLSSSDPPQNLKFEREDWTSFRTIEGLQQKAGIAKAKLPPLVLKELADNSLDTGAKVEVGKLPKGGYYVEDDGPGIDGTPEDIARLFSIRRPMVSTKLLRLPTRGALGNGLRVVAGAVLASAGSLVVITHNRHIKLRPERDGSTSVISAKKVTFPVGTRIEISFGPALPCYSRELDWAIDAIRCAAAGKTYAGRSSPWWYDVAQFHELLSAGSATPVRELIARLDGCTGGKAGEIVTQARLSRAFCKDVSRPQAARLLAVARENTNPVRPERLGAMEAEAFPGAYACARGTVAFGAAEPTAEIPVVVEAWATPQHGETNLTVCVNRTPITGNIQGARDKRDIDAFGCGLAHTIAQAPKDAQFDIRLNITTPYMPITSDGKEPDLEPFLAEIRTAVGKAVRKAHRPNAGSGTSQKDIVLENLDAVIAEVSGDGAFRFNARQLFYGLRPIVMQDLGKELKIGNFTGIITDYENENGDIAGMYREPRGDRGWATPIENKGKGMSIAGRRRNRINEQLSAHLISMLESPAWAVMSRGAHQFLSRLEIELCHHGGNDNGNLPLTYHDLMRYGMTRDQIAPAMREAEALGFAECTKRGRGGNAVSHGPKLCFAQFAGLSKITRAPCINSVRR